MLRHKWTSCLVVRAVDCGAASAGVKSCDGRASFLWFFLKSSKYESNSQRKGDLDDALLQMLTTDRQPCSKAKVKTQLNTQ